MPCSWGGNRRSGVALAMRHRVLLFIHLRVHSLRKGDEHPAYTPHGDGTLSFCQARSGVLYVHHRLRTSFVPNKAIIGVLHETWLGVCLFLLINYKRLP